MTPPEHGQTGPSPIEPQILRPGDLPAEEMIRMHTELEGDAYSASHREAWDRWHAWLDQLRAIDQTGQTERADRIGRYIALNFTPPRGSSRQAAALGGVVGGAGGAAYELGLGGGGAAASPAPSSPAPASPPSASSSAAAPPPASSTDSPTAASSSPGAPGSFGGAGATEAGNAAVQAGSRGLTAVLSGPGRFWAIFAASGTAAAVVVVAVVAAVGGFNGSAAPRSGALAAHSQKGNHGGGTKSGPGPGAQPKRPVPAAVHVTTTTRPPPTTGAPGTGAGAYTCNGPEIKLFDNTNGEGVSNGGTPASFSTGGTTYCLTELYTYHWDNGLGAPPGSIGLTSATGTKLGPFKAVGSSGSGGAKDVNWAANVATSPTPVTIKGAYDCTDSSPATWAQDAGTGGQGFCQVYVEKASRRK